MTLRKVQAGYGVWLAYLLKAVPEAFGNEPAAARPTGERLDSFFLYLRAQGCRDVTLHGRFIELRQALEWMYPGSSFKQVTHPDGVSLAANLDLSPRPMFVPDGAVALDWAHELLKAGLAHHKPRCRRALVREATWIAILTVAGPRVRALSSLRLGEHLERRGEEWVLIQPSAITKTGRMTGLTLIIPLPPEVGAIVDRYLSVERRELLQARQHDALWVAQGGQPLARQTIASRTRIRAHARFGQGFGPHRFRAIIATTIAQYGADAPLDGSAILGHTSPDMVLKAYNKAKALSASHRHAILLSNLRAIPKK